MKYYLVTGGLSSVPEASNNEVYNYDTQSIAARNYYVHNANLMKTRKASTYAGSVARNKVPNAIKEAQSLNVFKQSWKSISLRMMKHIFTFN